MKSEVCSEVFVGILVGFDVNEDGLVGLFVVLLSDLVVDLGCDVVGEAFEVVLLSKCVVVESFGDGVVVVG